MALTWAEWKSETGPDSNNFAERTITFDVACPVGRRAVVMVDLYTTTGVDTLAAWISDSGLNIRGVVDTTTLAEQVGAVQDTTAPRSE